MPKLKRETEMKRIEAKMQKLKDRLSELGYTLTDSCSVLVIFDDLDREENPEGKKVGYLI